MPADVLTGPSTAFDKTMLFHRVSRLAGDNLFDLPFREWLPRHRTIAPEFTDDSIAAYAPGTGDEISTIVSTWRDGQEADLNVESRRFALGVLGRTVLGMELGERAHRLEPHVKTILSSIMDRAYSPVRLPENLPTKAKRRFDHSLEVMRKTVDEAVITGRRDSHHRDTGLVAALLATTDPSTGERLADLQISQELGAFIVAGHDTTATAIAYSLWALGRHPDIQERVYEEVRTLPGGRLDAAALQRSR